MPATLIKAYCSSGCVFLTFDWADGKDHPDFLGFAIERTPGYKGHKSDFLLNKLDFKALAPTAKPKPTNLAPIQKFNWWDGGIETKDVGHEFTYRVTPVLGTGSNDLHLKEDAAGSIKVKIPERRDGKIASYFNRAVVSSQSFKAMAKAAPLEKQMDWLANGLQDAVPGILKESDGFDCAIYHLSDGRWIVPAFQAFKGHGLLVYFDKSIDHKSAMTLKNPKAKLGPNISVHARTKISKLMHDKFIVGFKGGHETRVLMGSTNFTPEAQTVQANLLHIIESPQLARLYAARGKLLAADPPMKQTDQAAGWKEVTDVPGTQLRVFFLPEPGTHRTFLDTVTNAVKQAKSSVLFCMFTASDQPLMDAIFAIGDRNDRLIYGLLNAIDDPDKPTKSGKPRKSSEVAVSIFHRSSSPHPDTISFDAFGQDAPMGFLPELRSIDTSKFDLSSTKAQAKGNGKGAKGPPPIHVHHKFIVIDGDTDHSTIYTGSPNFSKSSENGNDENVLEIKDNTQLTRVYVAEFMRLYNHYRARAIWERGHAKHGGSAKQSAQVPAHSPHEALVLKATRDGWVADAYKPGTKEFLARTRHL